MGVHHAVRHLFIPLEAGRNRGSRAVFDSFLAAFGPSRPQKNLASSSRQRSMAAKAELSSSFFSGAMPKEEIGALRFIKDHEECDGRGVVVGIFDTGIDPGVEGLRTTSDGKPKILDIIDGSGCGDVDMSKTVEANEDGYLTSLTDRLLKVNEEWKNPTGKWHIGSKRLFDLYSVQGFKSRCKEYRLKNFAQQQRSAMEIASKSLAAFDSENPQVKNDDDKKKQRSELQSRVTLLLEMMESHDDPGPILDCVVWHDGLRWLAAIDTTDLFGEGSSEGKLADFDPITNYCDGHQFSTFSRIDAGNFVCNIYNDGNLLSIVVDDNMHGTHVAGIIGANHPEEPDLNGIAPGAQIVSIKIGDSRENCRETPQSLARAAVGAHKNNVDVCNMSYGEEVRTPNCGRFSDLLRDLVFKRRIMFICASGNNGPGLSSVNSPGDTDATIGVGAYVSPTLAAAGHSNLEGVSGQIYSFSSRGPYADGCTGVTLCAPGGAISVVPQWTQESRHLANGTSMASPSACGGVALLLSSLKAAGKNAPLSLLKRALENSCLPVESDSLPAPLTYGNGLIQVDKAWEFLEKAIDLDIPDVRYDVQLQRSTGGPPGRGVYIREPMDTQKATVWNVTVSPQLHEDADVRKEKLAVEDRIRLVSSADWVTCPEGLLVTYNGRSFKIGVDSTHLSPGVHYAEVHGSDTQYPSRGILFRVPITVCIPLQVSKENQCTYNLGKQKMHPGKECHAFIVVPENATWAEITIRTGKQDGTIVYPFDVSQLITGSQRDTHSWSSYLRLSGDSTTRKAVPVIGGKTLGISFSQYWSSGSTSEVDVDIEFHSLRIERDHLHLDGGGGLLEFQVTAALKQEKLKPSASLESVSIPLRPAPEAKVVPVTDPRNKLPESKYLSKIVLAYKLSVKEAGKFTPTAPQLDNQIYDGLVDAMAILVHDENKKRLHSQSVFPSSVMLKKGDHTIRVQICHEKPEFLEKLKDMVLVMVRTLEKPISLPIYPSRHALLSRGAQFCERQLHLGETTVLAIGNPTDELPKDCVPGSLMNGSVTLGEVSMRNGPDPCKVQLTYTVPPTKQSNDNDKAADADEKSAQDRVVEGVRDAKIKILEGLDPIKDSDSYRSLFKELNEAFPNHVPLLSANLKKMDALEGTERTEKLPEIIKAAIQVQNQINQEQLAIFLARKTPAEGKEASIQSKEMKKMESALIAALKAHAGALLDMGDDNNAEIKHIFDELGKWVDTTDPLHSVLKSRVDASCERWAEAICSLDKALASDDRDKTKDKQLRLTRAEYMGKLGWPHWENHFLRCMHVDFPHGYELF